MEYIHSNLNFLVFKAIIRNKDGNKYNAKGIVLPKRKLKKESLTKADCVFTYTAQKQVIKYQ